MDINEDQFFTITLALSELRQVMLQGLKKIEGTEKNELKLQEETFYKDRLEDIIYLHDNLFLEGENKGIINLTKEKTEEEKITMKEYYRRKGIELPKNCGFFGYEEPYYGA